MIVWMASDDQEQLRSNATTHQPFISRAGFRITESLDIERIASFLFAN
jgi:hypothetical protein